MSSGLGLKGNVSRCFEYFQDFSVCMKTSDDPKKLCLAARDDYLECLHHKKELMRNLAIADEAARQASGGGGSGGGGGH